MGHAGVAMQLQALDTRCDPHVATAEGADTVLVENWSAHALRAVLLIGVLYEVARLWLQKPALTVVW